MSNIDIAAGRFNPQFWAYGSLPIYIIYLVTWVFSLVHIGSTITFEQLILTGRLLSALSSIALIPLTYLLTQEILHKTRWKDTGALLAALWVAFLPGMIQFAHFMTFETFLALQYVGLLLLCIRIARTGEKKYYLWAAIVLGLSVGTKITSVVVAPTFALAHFMFIYQTHRRQWWRKLVTPNIIAAVLITAGVTVICSPFHILDWDGFKNSLTYESGVADGTWAVFYTQQFKNTLNGIYQLFTVFPYILGIPLTLISLLALVHVSIGVVRSFFSAFFNNEQIPYSVIVMTFLLVTIGTYLGFHFTLYVKWTRYMVPVLPLLVGLSAGYIFGILFPLLVDRSKRRYIFSSIIICVISLWVIMQGLSFWRMYPQQDTRIAAAQWASSHIQLTDLIASEPYDLGIMPFQRYFPAEVLKLLPLYDAETEPSRTETLSSLSQADYMIVLSQRIWRTRFRLPNWYPVGTAVYKELKNEDGWDLAATFTQEQINCNIWTLYCFNGQVLPDETFTVFDHPTIEIYKKTHE